MNTLEKSLRGRRDAGGKAFVPYVTGGLPGVDAALLSALAEVGADAIEVGIPHSDPVMDGGVIQEASRLALEAGTTPASVLAMIRAAALDIPVCVMTYANPVWRPGLGAFLDEVRDAGVAGTIVPDVPVDEADELIAETDARGLDNVLLAAPGTAADRLARIGAASRGFVYCVATYGVTGARDELAGSAQTLVEALRPATDLPLLVGVGIGTAEQAADVCTFADGVIVGSALVRCLVDGDRAAAAELARDFRAAIPV